MKETVFNNSIGYFKVASNKGKLVSIDYSKKNDFISEYQNQEDEFNNFVINELKEYFSGERKYFDIPIDISNASIFNRAVWEELQNVDYGNISTYKIIAEKIGKPKAMRAVGTAIGKNPIPIIIPCHRIVRTDGKIGGFGFGVDVKKVLLNIEQNDVCKKKF